MPTIVTDEYLTSTDDNRTRPYSVGISRHKETISSILVYNEETDEQPTDDKTQNTFSGKNVDVKALQPTSPDTGSADTPTNQYKRLSSGSISKLSLDDRDNVYYGIFNNFSLLNVSESSEQIVKLHVNFGADWNAFFFGEKPKIFRYEGFFLDATNYPFYQEFMVAYDKYLSGRKAIENKMKTKFVYDGKIIDGYMLGVTTNITAGDQLIKRFQFTVLVKSVTWVRTNDVPVEKSAGGRKFKVIEEQFNGLSNSNRISNSVSPQDIIEGSSSISTPAPVRLA